MRLEHYSIEKLKKEITAIVKRYHDELNGARVFFFGSRVDGSGTERSDIDIGIEGPTPIPLATLRKLKEEIKRIPLLYQIDIIDFKTTSEDFREVALKHIELIVSIK
jgi:predicted nucleotidyltransferase